MPVEIVEVVERSVQGITQPYVCRGDDDEVYFVKGRSASRKGLICEFLAGSIAKSLGLPIAPFDIAIVPQELIEADTGGWLNDLGVGEAFASKRIRAVEFTDSHLQHVPIEQRRDVAVFDWWVKNSDRTLTRLGGNPNLLWSTELDGGLVVIDHNLAFDAGVTIEQYLDSHVFASDIPPTFADFVLRHEYAERMTAVLADWDDMCASIPGSWWYIDPEQTIPVDFDLTAIRQLLDRAFEPAFWLIPE